jgi:hypothetical protein
MLEIPAWLVGLLIAGEALWLARRWQRERDPMILAVMVWCGLLAATYAFIELARTGADQRTALLRWQFVLYFLTLNLNHLIVFLKGRHVSH